MRRFAVAAGDRSLAAPVVVVADGATIDRAATVGFAVPIPAPALAAFDVITTFSAMTAIYLCLFRVRFLNGELVCEMKVLDLAWKPSVAFE